MNVPAINEILVDAILHFDRDGDFECWELTVQAAQRQGLVPHRANHVWLEQHPVMPESPYWLAFAAPALRQLLIDGIMAWDETSNYDAWMDLRREFTPREWEQQYWHVWTEQHPALVRAQSWDASTDDIPF